MLLLRPQNLGQLVLGGLGREDVQLVDADRLEPVILAGRWAEHVVLDGLGRPDRVGPALLGDLGQVLRNPLHLPGEDVPDDGNPPGVGRHERSLELGVLEPPDDDLPGDVELPPQGEEGVLAPAGLVGQEVGLALGPGDVLVQHGPGWGWEVPGLFWWHLRLLSARSLVTVWPSRPQGRVTEGLQALRRRGYSVCPSKATFCPGRSGASRPSRALRSPTALRRFAPRYRAPTGLRGQRSLTRF